MRLSKQSRKIAISFIIVLSLSMTMMVFDLTRIKNMQSKLDVITKENNIKTSLMMVMLHGIYNRQVSLRNIVLMEDPFDRDEGKTKFSSYALNIISARKEFSLMNLNEKEKALLQEINDAMPIAYVAQMNLIDKSIYDPDKKITSDELDITFQSQALFMSKVKAMVELQKKSTSQAVLDAEQSYQSAKKSIFILGGGAFLFSILIAIYIIRFTESQQKRVKVAISELEESHDLLEQRVSNRTVELAKARDAALESNRAKDNFIATMSHELRTPLNIIIGYSEILEELAEEENIKSFIPDLKKIQSAAYHQLKLVSNILDISKIEEGKLEISPIDFDIEKLVSEIKDASQPLMKKNNNEFKVVCQPKIGMMYSDNIRIHQILLNLLSNAGKFTHDGLITLNVSQNVAGDKISFIIEDTGMGISDSYMEEMFDKFTQADTSTTRKYGGSGLGLSISKQLSQQLKGDIIVTSDKGKGSIFSLILPIIYIA